MLTLLAKKNNLSTPQSGTLVFKEGVSGVYFCDQGGAYVEGSG